MNKTDKNIWRIRAASDRYRTLTREDHSFDYVGLLDLFKSRKTLGQDWKPISLILFVGEDGEESQEDRPIPDIAHGLVTFDINEKARFYLEPLIANQVEFLPMITTIGPYYELNIRSVDCLDDRRSSVIRFPGRGRIMDVEKYAFHWGKLIGINIFIIPELDLSCFFVSDAFKKVVEENNLTGLIFDSVSLI